MAISKFSNFSSSDKGWLSELGDINLSKISIGKGFTISVEHFGILDPYFGTDELADYDECWYYDDDLIKSLIKTFNLTSELDRYATSKDSSFKGQSLNRQLAILSGDKDRVLEFFTSVGLCKGEAICGITDEEYLKDCLMNTKWQDYVDSDILKIVQL